MDDMMMVDLRIADGVSSTQLHDLWLELFRRRNEMAMRSGELWRQWKAAETVAKSAWADRLWKQEADRLWRQYMVLQRDYRVLSAWTDLLHTGWVFSTDGRECSVVGDLLLTDGVPDWVAALTS
jgi:hypothetical protein